MVSKSPNRFSFQKENYVKRQEEKGEEVREEYLNIFETVEESHAKRFDDPKSRENNLEYDLLTTDWILEKVRSSDAYAQNLYAAFCNNEFQKIEVVPILKDQRWSASWRYAGGIIADMRQKGDYIDWYCSGINPIYEDTDPGNGYVPEEHVTEEIRDDLKRLGWIVIENTD